MQIQYTISFLALFWSPATPSRNIWLFSSEIRTHTLLIPLGEIHFLSHRTYRHALIVVERDQSDAAAT